MVLGKAEEDVGRVLWLRVVIMGMVCVGMVVAGVDRVFCEGMTWVIVVCWFCCRWCIGFDEMCGRLMA